VVGPCRSTLSFWGTSILTSMVAALVYVPTCSVWGLPFPCILAAFSVCFFGDGRADWGDMESQPR
jgi:hypothetical protein